MSAPAQRPHGLGPDAIEIVGDDWAHCFVAIGENVHFSQPRPIDVETTDDGLTIMGHASALALADALISALRPSGRRQDELFVAIIEDRLVISIGIDSLMTAVRGADFWDDESLSIIDADEFAADIVRELEREQDDGTTPVHLMIDAAAEQAVDQGSLGVADAVDDAEVGDDG